MNKELYNYLKFHNCIIWDSTYLIGDENGGWISVEYDDSISTFINYLHWYTEKFDWNDINPLVHKNFLKFANRFKEYKIKYRNLKLNKLL